MKEIGIIKKNDMERVSLFGKMVLNMKVPGKMIKRVGQAP
jgi:hypothetical protein